MLKIRDSFAANRPRPRRTGGFVVKELMLLLVCLVSLCGLGARSLDWLALDDVHQLARSRLARSASVRYVSRISSTQEGAKLWICRPLHSIALVNLDTGETEQGLMTENRRLSRVAHNLDGTTSLMVWVDGIVELYPDGIGSPPATFRLLTTGESEIDAAVSANGTIALCVLRNGVIQGWFNRESEVEEFHYSLADSAVVCRAGMDPDGSQLFVAREDGTAGVHQVLSDTHEERPLTLSGKCVAAIWSADGQSLLIATQDGKVSLIDPVSGQNQWQGTLSAPQVPLSLWADSLAISRDGKWVAAASSLLRTFDVWQLDSKQPVRSLAGHDGVIRSLEFSTDSQRVYSGSLDGTVREWTLADAAQRRIID